MKYIEALFKEFNRKYFRNQIPEIAIYYGRGHVSEWAYFSDDRKVRIVLSPTLKDYQLACEGILLHEMVHAYLWTKYQDRPYDSFLWMEHTKEFRNIERMNNKRHFGNPRGHTYYFNLMMKDLDNNREP